MTSLAEMRRHALDAVRSTDWTDAGDRGSTEMFLMAYNAAVPFEYQVGQSVILTAELGNLDISSRDSGRASMDLGEAVAFMAKEIARPGSPARLSASDYERAALVQSVSGSLVMLAPSRGDLGAEVLDGVEAKTVTELALERLVALMPSEQVATDLDVDAILSTRSTSRRALGKVLDLAARSDGLRLSVSGSRDPQRAQVSADLAEELGSALRAENVGVSRRRVLGYLEGARTIRRRFYLMPESKGRELWGSVDEDVVSNMATMVDKMVFATLEVTQTSARSGMPARETFRLVEIERALDHPRLTD